jgi:hypothetical protein
MDWKNEGETGGWVCRMAVFFGVFMHDFFALQTTCH